MVYSGFHAVSSHLQGYFKNLLGPSSTTRIPVDPSIISLGNTLPVDMQHLLCAPFTDTDIRDAIFSIPVLKSPGPDGFGSGFFKATWHITGPLVCSAIHHFFRTSHLPKNFGRTKLCLIPKTPTPTQAKDFRPISCCSVIYKGITKLLCSRLKIALPHLIHQSQGAFVEGRELLFNVLICQDLVRGYSRTGISPRCIMKVDVHKAFHSVHWGFIRELLDNLKFPTQLTKWVMACISSVSYTILVNGVQGEAFEGGRGLKQGDRLSPLLFALAMDYFSPANAAC